MIKHKYASLVLGLFTLAGLLYNSWPLGYLLNSQTAHSGLASDLEKVGQPYYWVFRGGDILTGVCLGIAGICMLQKVALATSLRGLWYSISIGAVVFGFFTAVASLVPAHCNIGTHLVCNSQSGVNIGLDAIFSAIAALGLCLSLIGSIIFSIRAQLSLNVRIFAQLSAAFWSISGVLFVFYAVSSGYAHQAQLVQQVFLFLTGVVLVAIGCTTSAFIVLKTLSAEKR